MPDPNDYIRKRIREVREDSGMSQRELAKEFGCSQVSLSDIERGVTKVNAADLIRFANILGRSVLYFLPGVEQSDLDDREQTLVGIFRQMDDDWKDTVLDVTRKQLCLYQQIMKVEAQPEELQRQYADEGTMQLFDQLGLSVTLDESGNPRVELKEVGDPEAVRQLTELAKRRQGQPHAPR